MLKFLFLLLLGVAQAADAGPALDAIAKRGAIVIAHRESSVPFSYLDGSKQPVGYAVDICKHIADAVRLKLGLKTLPIQYVQVTGANRIATIVEHKADLECGSTTNNEERRKIVAFTFPYFLTSARFLVRSDSKIERLRDFHDATLVSTAGTTPLKQARELNKESSLRINVVEAPDHLKAVEMVETGKADGFVMDDVLLYSLRATRPDPNKLKVVGNQLTFEVLSAMMAKDDPELKAIADAEMRRLIVSREIYAIYDRWFMKPIPPNNVALNLPMQYLLKDLWKFPSDWAPN